jgi:hypothetical protein
MKVGWKFDPAEELKKAMGKEDERYVLDDLNDVD